jgi:putative membrane protein (TIGR04086 family)
MISGTKSKTVRPSSPLMSGLLCSLVLMLAGTLLTSLFLYGTNMKEASLPSFAYGIHGLSLLFGGIAAGKRSESKGWYQGGLLGLLYCVFILIIAFLAYDQGFNSQTLTLLLVTLGAGALGGIIGVNLRK